LEKENLSAIFLSNLNPVSFNVWTFLAKYFLLFLVCIFLLIRFICRFEWILLFLTLSKKACKFRNLNMIKNLSKSLQTMLARIINLKFKFETQAKSQVSWKDTENVPLAYFNASILEWFVNTGTCDFLWSISDSLHCRFSIYGPNFYLTIYLKDPTFINKVCVESFCSGKNQRTSFFVFHIPHTYLPIIQFIFKTWPLVSLYWFLLQPFLWH